MEAKIIAGNFKSNKTHSETMAYLNALDSALDSADSQNLIKKSCHSERSEESKNNNLVILSASEESQKNKNRDSSVVSLPQNDNVGRDSSLRLRSAQNDKVEARNYKVEAENDNFGRSFAESSIYIFPSICAMCENNFKNLTLGAQNAHFAESGAFTGEATLAHLRDFKIDAILIGHSERRNIFGESDEVVAQKFDFFSKHNMEIFLCVGENLDVRKSGKTKDFLRAQLEKINLDYARLIIAYEPIWAIGTGENASLAQIDEIYEFLKDFTKKQIIYGGSVNERNAGEILRISDGVLVGNASLEVEKFYQIIKGGKE